jgi:hypothetical protein
MKVLLFVAVILACSAWKAPRPDNPNGTVGHINGGAWLINVPTNQKGVWAHCLMRAHYKPSCHLFWRQQP